MSRAGRRLSPEEAALWARLAQTVTPLHPEISPPAGRANDPMNGEGARPGMNQVRGTRVSSRAPPAPMLRPASPPTRAEGEQLGAHGLDASWERRLARGLVHPDVTLDLHGASLEAAHARLLRGLAQAKAMGARLVLLITGRPRPVDAVERGRQRGAIRANAIDWLAASEHARDIAAIRHAHRRHGGHGALYIVLKKRRS